MATVCSVWFTVLATPIRDLLLVRDRYRGLQYRGTIEAEWKTERISDLLNPKSQNDLSPIQQRSQISQRFLKAIEH